MENKEHICFVESGLSSSSPCWVIFLYKRSLHFLELWWIHFVILATNQEWYHSLDQDGLKCWQSYDRTLSVMIQGTSSEWTKSLRLQGRKQSGFFSLFKFYTDKLLFFCNKKFHEITRSAIPNIISVSYTHLTLPTILLV